MPAAPKIWIVDDDPSIRLVFSRALTDAGHRVTECEDGLQAVERLRTETPGLVILDVEMPRLDGWGTLEELRRRGFTQPVLMLTHVNDVNSRVRGLEAGADDYLGKPCSVAELLARVRALLRRAGSRTKAGAKLRFGDVRIDLEEKTATRAGAPLRLTRTDFALLALLHENRGKPMAREVILSRLWGGQAVNSHALETHLWRLRKKLGDDGEGSPWIQNVSGIGYCMTMPE